MDDRQPNGGRYVTVREWAKGRTDDQRDIARDRELEQANLERRVMASLNNHIDLSEKAHRAQDDRTARLADGLDKIQSVLDQQRGARNILLFLAGTSLIEILVLVLTIYVAIK